MIRHPLERAYKLLAQSLEKNDEEKIQLASEIEAHNTCVGKETLGFDALPYSHPRVEMIIQLNKNKTNEWEDAVAEAVDAIQILRI